MSGTENTTQAVKANISIPEPKHPGNKNTGM